MDYLVRRLVDRSTSTIKADAARFMYAAEGDGIVWAVLDSGIDATHQHFQTYGTLSGEVAKLHRDFTALWDEAPASDLVSSALVDREGHGTHVAGIIAGALLRGGTDHQVVRHCAAEHVSVAATLNRGIGPSDIATLRVHEREVEEFTEFEEVDVRTIDDASRLSGVAPRCKLVSLKVLDDTGEGRTSTVIMALRYIADVANDSPSLPRIHGANLSLGYSYNAKAFACGQSPLCCEVDRLVRSGVVVVTAAGNSGYGEVAARAGRSDAALALTINDPGNAALAITVGSTHRDAPHTYGVSFFSSKGPTADGRLKPDLVAPGERITSCATGRMLENVRAVLDNGSTSGGARGYYVDSSGTSMAAPHVSGAIAVFLSVHREFIGNPAAVKRIFLDSATSLGREAYFQGHGLLDLVRALNAV
jgi:subtilisin family serine protease